MKFINLALLVFVFWGCSPKRDIPPLNVEPIATEKCRHIGMNLKVLTPAHVRGLTHCLNSNQRFAPVEALVDRLSDSEIETLIKPYNHYLSASQIRFDQTFGLLERLQKNGVLKSSYADLQVLSETGVLRASLPILASLLDSEASNSGYGSHTPVRSILNSTHVLLKNDGLFPLIQAGAHFFGSPRAKEIASVLNLTNTPLKESFVNSLKHLVDSGALDHVILGMSDPTLIRSLTLTTDDLNKGAGLLAWLAQDQERFARVSELTRTFDQPLRCFSDSQKKSAVEVKNVFEVFVKERLRRDGELEASDRFLIVEMNLLIGTLLEKCELSDTMRRDAERARNLLNEVTVNGFAPACASLMTGFEKQDRLEYLKAIIKSPAYQELGRAVTPLEQMGALVPLMGVFGHDFKQEDALTFGRAATLLTLPEIKGEALTSWLKAHPDLHEVQVRPDTSLRSLIIDLDRRGENQLSKKIRLAWAQEPEVDIENRPFHKWLSQVLSADTSRTEQRDLMFSSLNRALKDERGGAGHLFTVMASAMDSAHERPLQEFLSETLADEKVINEVVPVLKTLFKMDEFADALEFIGTLAARGDLDQIARLLIDLYRSTGQQGLQSGPVGEYTNPSETYTSEAGTQFHYAIDARKYEACLKLKGSLFEESGENIFLALHCLDAKGQYPGLSRVAETLKEKHLLTSAVHLIQASFLRSEAVPDMIQQLDQMLKAGVIDDLFSMIRGASEKKVIAQVEILLGLTLDETNPDAHRALLCVDDVLRIPTFSKSLPSVLKLLTEEGQPFFTVDANYKMNLGEQEQKLRTEARQRAPELSESEFEGQFARAKREFESRSSDYYFRSGVYPQFTDEQMVSELSKYAAKFLKYDNLEQVLLALEDLARANEPDHRSAIGDLRGLDIGQFLDTAVGTYRVIKYFPGPGKPYELRIVTPLDQLEILVLNVDISMASWIPFLGVRHVGTYYQVQVARSKNLEETLNALRNVVDLGWQYTQVLETEKHYKMENDRENFYVLQDLARSGELRVFQRLYQALYLSTPAAFRDTADQNVNQMALAHDEMKYIFLSRLVPILHQLRSQGKLKIVIDRIFNSFKTTPREDHGRVRTLYQHLVTGKLDASTTHLEFILQRLMRDSHNSKLMTALAQVGYQLVSGIERVIPRLGGALDAITAALKSPALTRRFITDLINEAESTNSRLSSVAGRMNALTDGEASLARATSLAVFTPDTNGASCALSVGQLLRRGFDNNSVQMNRSLDALRALLNDPEIKALKISSTLSRVIARLETDTGFRTALEKLVRSPDSRQALLQFLVVASKSGLITDLSHDIVSNKEVKEFLQFMALYLNKVSMVQ